MRRSSNLSHTPGNVLRSLGLRHPDQGDELNALADIIDVSTTKPFTTAKLKNLNGAWVRGVYWCNHYAEILPNDAEPPLTMP